MMTLFNRVWLVLLTLLLSFAVLPAAWSQTSQLANGGVCTADLPCPALAQALQQREKDLQRSCEPMFEHMYTLYQTRDAYYGQVRKMFADVDEFENGDTDSFAAVLKPFERLQADHNRLKKRVQDWGNAHKKSLLITHPDQRRWALGLQKPPIDEPSIMGRPKVLLSFNQAHIDAARGFDHEQEDLFLKWYKTAEAQKGDIQKVLAPHLDKLTGHQAELNKIAQKSQNARAALTQAFEDKPFAHCIGHPGLAHFDDPSKQRKLRTKDIPGMTIPLVDFSYSTFTPTDFLSPPPPEEMVFVRDGLAYVEVAYEKAMDDYDYTYKQYELLGQATYQAGMTVTSITRSGITMANGMYDILKKDQDNISEFRRQGQFDPAVAEAKIVAYSSARVVEELTLETVKGLFDTLLMAVDDISYMTAPYYEALAVDNSLLGVAEAFKTDIGDAYTALESRIDFIISEELNADPDEFVDDVLRGRGIRIDNTDIDYMLAATDLYNAQTRRLREAMDGNAEAIAKVDNLAVKATAYGLALLDAQRFVKGALNRRPDVDLTNAEVRALDEFGKISASIGETRLLNEVRKTLNGQSVSMGDQAIALASQYRKLEAFGRANGWPDQTSRQRFEVLSRRFDQYKNQNVTLRQAKAELDAYLDAHRDAVKKAEKGRRAREEEARRKKEEEAEDPGNSVPDIDGRTLNPVEVIVLGENGKPILNPDGTPKTIVISYGDQLGKPSKTASVYASNTGLVIKELNTPNVLDLPDGTQVQLRNPDGTLNENGLAYQANVQQRISHGQELAGAAGIATPGTTAYMRPDGTMVFQQDRLPANALSENFFDLDGNPLANLTPAHQAAIAEAQQKLKEKNLFHLDGHHQNWYFFEENGRVKAGLIDWDGIVDLSENPNLFKAFEEVYYDGVATSADAIKALNEIGVNDIFLKNKAVVLASIQTWAIEHAQKKFGKIVNAPVTGTVGLHGKIIGEFNGLSPNELAKKIDDLSNALVDKELAKLEQIEKTAGSRLKKAREKYQKELDKMTAETSAFRTQIDDLLIATKDAYAKLAGGDIPGLRDALGEISIASFTRRALLRDSEPRIVADNDNDQGDNDKDPQVKITSYEELLESSQHRQTYISYMRQKIGRLGMRPFLFKPGETLRNEGLDKRKRNAIPLDQSPEVIREYMSQAKDSALQNYQEDVAHYETCCGPYGGVDEFTVADARENLPKPFDIHTRITAMGSGFDDEDVTYDGQGLTGVSLYVPSRGGIKLAVNPATAHLTGTPEFLPYHVTATGYKSETKPAYYTANCAITTVTTNNPVNADSLHPSGAGLSVDSSNQRISISDDDASTYVAGITYMRDIPKADGTCNSPLQIDKEETESQVKIKAIKVEALGIPLVDQTTPDGRSTLLRTPPINVFGSTGQWLDRAYVVAEVDDPERGRSLLNLRWDRVKFTMKQTGPVRLSTQGRMSIPDRDKAGRSIVVLEPSLDLHGNDGLQNRYIFDKYAGGAVTLFDRQGLAVEGRLDAGTEYIARVSLQAPKEVTTLPFDLNFEIDQVENASVRRIRQTAFKLGQNGWWTADLHFSMSPEDKSNAVLLDLLESNSGVAIQAYIFARLTDRNPALYTEDIGLRGTYARLKPTRSFSLGKLFADVRQEGFTTDISGVDLFAGASRPRQSIQLNPEILLGSGLVDTDKYPEVTKTLSRHLYLSDDSLPVDDQIDFDIDRPSPGQKFPLKPIGASSRNVGYYRQGAVFRTPSTGHVLEMGLSETPTDTVTYTINQPVFTITRNLKGEPKVNMTIIGPADMSTYKALWSFTGADTQTVFRKTGNAWVSTALIKDKSRNPSIRVNILDDSGESVAEYDTIPLNITGVTLDAPSQFGLGQTELIGATVYAPGRFDVSAMRCRWFFPAIYGRVTNGTPGDTANVVYTDVSKIGDGGQCIANIDVTDSPAVIDSLAEISVKLISPIDITWSVE